MPCGTEEVLVGVVPGITVQSWEDERHSRTMNRWKQPESKSLSHSRFFSEEYGWNL